MFIDVVRRGIGLLNLSPNNLSCADRMQAEVEFLNYANKVASGFTPKLFHVDFIKRCIILEILEVCRCLLIMLEGIKLT